jgi:hypothetical protein
MKRFLLATVFVAPLALLGVALAQTPQAPVGQTKGGAISADTFNANTQSAGFNASSLTSALAVPATSTAQATFSPGGTVLTGTVIPTKTTVITTCSGTTGVTLPAVTRFETVTLLNRSGGSCLVWPSLGAALETALGTTAAANASFTMLTNTDVNFRPTIVGSTVTWYQ